MGRSGMTCQDDASCCALILMPHLSTHPLPQRASLGTHGQCSVRTHHPNRGGCGCIAEKILVRSWQMRALTEALDDSNARPLLRRPFSMIFEVTAVSSEAAGGATSLHGDKDVIKLITIMVLLMVATYHCHERP